MAHLTDVSGTAALAICESLLLALNDRNILPEHEIVGIQQEAAAAHANDPGEDGASELLMAVAALINNIVAGGNSVRRRRVPKRSTPKFLIVGLGGYAVV